MGPRAGLDGRKISSPPGFFFIVSNITVVISKRLLVPYWFLWAVLMLDIFIGLQIVLCRRS